MANPIWEIQKAENTRAYGEGISYKLGPHVPLQVLGLQQWLPAQGMKGTVTLTMGCSTACTKPLRPSPALYKWNLVLQACNLSTWQMEVEQKVQGSKPGWATWVSMSETKRKEARKERGSAKWGDRPDPKVASHWASLGPLAFQPNWEAQGLLFPELSICPTQELILLELSHAWGKDFTWFCFLRVKIYKGIPVRT